MSTEWAVERLDALPEGTVLTFLDAVGEWDLALRARSRRGGELVWMMPDRAGAWWTSSRLLERGTDHRVVSVPVNALLTEDAIEAAADAAWVDDAAGWSARAAIRAAIAHITGEAS